jgi:thiamine-phosphate pyrophosphorylase
MAARHPKTPVPRLWLMTDERIGDALWQAIDALPRGSGIIFRHYATAPRERRALFARIARIARRRRLVLLRAGPNHLGRGAMGAHGGSGTGRNSPGRGWRSAPAHNRRDAIAGQRAGADMMFISPVHPTRSHPGSRSLGPLRAAAIARGLKPKAIALGGMDATRFRRLRPFGFHGWAAIDAWIAG